MNEDEVIGKFVEKNNEELLDSVNLMVCFIRDKYRTGDKQVRAFIRDGSDIGNITDLQIGIEVRRKNSTKVAIIKYSLAPVFMDVLTNRNIKKNEIIDIKNPKFDLSILEDSKKFIEKLHESIEYHVGNIIELIEKAETPEEAKKRSEDILQNYRNSKSVVESSGNSMKVQNFNRKNKKETKNDLVNKLEDFFNSNNN